MANADAKAKARRRPRLPREIRTVVNLNLLRDRTGCGPVNLMRLAVAMGFEVYKQNSQFLLPTEYQARLIRAVEEMKAKEATLLCKAPKSVRLVRTAPAAISA